MIKRTDKQLRYDVVRHHQANLRMLMKAESIMGYVGNFCFKLEGQRGETMCISIGPDSCAFCRIYNVYSCWKCQNSTGFFCPIVQRTQEPFCQKTPWNELSRALESKNLPTAIKAEKDEINFLLKLEV